MKATGRLKKGEAKVCLSSGMSSLRLGLKVWLAFFFPWFHPGFEKVCARWLDMEIYCAMFALELTGREIPDK